KYPVIALSADPRRAPWFHAVIGGKSPLPPGPAQEPKRRGSSPLRPKRSGRGAQRLDGPPSGGYVRRPLGRRILVCEADTLLTGSPEGSGGLEARKLIAQRREVPKYPTPLSPCMAQQSFGTATLGMLIAPGTRRIKMAALLILDAALLGV